MRSFLYPDEYLDSTYSIDFDKLYNDENYNIFLYFSITPN